MRTIGCIWCVWRGRADELTTPLSTHPGNIGYGGRKTAFANNTLYAFTPVKYFFNFARENRLKGVLLLALLRKNPALYLPGVELVVK